MAFKKIQSSQDVYESPDRLFLDLPKRTHESLYDHQGQVLRNYVKKALTSKDVAIQLPTGSGKTLVGLLLAEWRRRKNKEKVVYLCPTKQLVHQVVSEANEKYGLSVVGFTGSVKDYTPSMKAAYQDSNKIAVTTYSSLFNSNPFFSDADIILIDDAHSSENYFQQLWNFSVKKSIESESDNNLYSAICCLLKNIIPTHNYERLIGSWTDDYDDIWVDKIPINSFNEIIDQLRATIDTHVTSKSNLKYTWKMIRDHLHACQMYISKNEISIRPLITPTWTQPAFSNAKQRIYMSATLGLGGDLERLTGRNNIQRLEIPAGWDKQGIGRHLFFFPEKSLKNEDVIKLQNQLIEQVPRSVILTSHQEKVEAIRKTLEDVNVYTAQDLEEDKNNFLHSKKSVAVIANRYDGIDFPNDDCRLLFLNGISKGTNLQENFLIKKMGANLLFNSRIQTRVLQAIGRCTRGLKDYAAIVVTGEELGLYLTNYQTRQYFHPELQAELEFSIQQSTDVDLNTFTENFDIFINQNNEWNSANEMILALRAEKEQKDFPSMIQLQSSVNSEIKWQKNLWDKDFIGAYDEAKSVLAVLKDPALKGYRALWEYLAGSSLELAIKYNQSLATNIYFDHYLNAKNSAVSITWLNDLARKITPNAKTEREENKKRIAILQQVEKIEKNIEDLGLMNNHKFFDNEKNIREGLKDPNLFEQTQVHLARYIGLSADKIESEGSPDPWWYADDYVIIFEDYVDSNIDSKLDIKKARQAASHPRWLKENTQFKDKNILPVLVATTKKYRNAAYPHIKELSYWNYKDFQDWAEKCLETIKSLRINIKLNDLDWKAQAVQKIVDNKLDIFSLFDMLEKQKAKDLMISS